MGVTKAGGKKGGEWGGYKRAEESAREVQAKAGAVGSNRSYEGEAGRALRGHETRR